MTMKEQVEKCLENIRPALAMHKGNVTLVDVDNGVVRLSLEGACKGCPMSQITLKMGIEAEIMANVPGITQIVAIGEDEKSCCEDGSGECCNGTSQEDTWFRELLGQE